MVVWILIWFIWSGNDVSFSPYISQQSFSNCRNTIYIDIPLKKFTRKKFRFYSKIILLGLSMCLLLLYIMKLFCDDNIIFSVLIYIHLAHNQNTKIIRFYIILLLFLSHIFETRTCYIALGGLKHTM